MKFNVLSVAEDDYNSDRISGAQKNIKYTQAGRYSPWNPPYPVVKELRLSITAKQQLTIAYYTEGTVNALFTFDELDIDGMIEYLQQAKAYISEEKMFAKLVGKRS